MRETRKSALQPLEVPRYEQRGRVRCSVPSSTVARPFPGPIETHQSSRSTVETTMIERSMALGRSPTFLGIGRQRDLGHSMT